MKRMPALIFTLSLLMLCGCAMTGSKSKLEKRQAVLTMKNEVLSDLYKIRPDVKAQISRASGYAVFSNVNKRWSPIFGQCVKVDGRTLTKEEHP